MLFFFFNQSKITTNKSLNDNTRSYLKYYQGWVSFWSLIYFLQLFLIISDQFFCRCNLRVVDSFGTEAQFNVKTDSHSKNMFGYHGLNLKQYNTMFRKYYYKLFITFFKNFWWLKNIVQVDCRLARTLENFNYLVISNFHVKRNLENLTDNSKTFFKISRIFELSKVHYTKWEFMKLKTNGDLYDYFFGQSLKDKITGTKISGYSSTALMMSVNLKN